MWTMTALPLIGAPRIDRAAYERLAKRARLLSWLSLAWMTVEGAVAIAAGLVLLAPYVAVESARALIGGTRPDETWAGIALAASSVVLMPLLGIAKQRIADQIGSAATKGEGRQNMLCAYLAAALLIGLLGNAAFGAWWLDPVVGLLIAAVAVKEGREAWRGEGCCVSSPLDGAGFDCADDCCSPH